MLNNNFSYSDFAQISVVNDDDDVCLFAKICRICSKVGSKINSVSRTRVSTF